MGATVFTHCFGVNSFFSKTVKRKFFMWRRLSAMDRALLILGVLMLVPGVILFYLRSDAISMWIGVLGGWLSAFVVVRQAVLERAGNKSSVLVVRAVL